MTKYSCKSCNYRFEFEGDKPKKCPYCDVEGSVAKEQTVNEILNELDQIK